MSQVWGSPRLSTACSSLISTQRGSFLVLQVRVTMLMKLHRCYRILFRFLNMCSCCTEKIERTVQIEASTVEIEERGVKLRLTVVDTPGYGDAINSQDWWELLWWSFKMRSAQIQSSYMVCMLCGFGLISHLMLFFFWKGTIHPKMKKSMLCKRMVDLFLTRT